MLPIMKPLVELQLEPWLHAFNTPVEPRRRFQIPEFCTSFTAVEAQKHTYRVHVPTQVGSQIICSAGFLLFSSLPRMHRSIRLNSLRALQRNFQLQNTPGTASPGIYSGVALACWRWGNWRTDDSDFAVRRGFATMATNTNTYKFNHSMYGNLVSKQAGP